MFWIWNIEQKIFVHWTIVWNRQDWCWKIECRWFNVRWAVEKIYTWKCDSDVAFDFVSTVRPFTFFFEIIEVIRLLYYLPMEMSPYELAKIIRDFVNYQQNEIDTYKIILFIETIMIILLSCELAWRHLLG